MRNRAKCKLCKDIIESFHPTDYVTCKCGEIAVDGGLALRCAANKWENFLRVDDEGNEIIIKTDDVSIPLDPKEKPKKADLIKLLDDVISKIDNLPPKALESSVNHYDLLSLLLILSSIFKAED